MLLVNNEVSSLDSNDVSLRTSDQGVSLELKLKVVISSEELVVVENSDDNFGCGRGIRESKRSVENSATNGEFKERSTSHNWSPIEEAFALMLSRDS